MVGRAPAARLQTRVLVTDEVQKEKPHTPLRTKLRFVPRKIVTAGPAVKGRDERPAGALDRVPLPPLVSYAPFHIDKSQRRHRGNDNNGMNGLAFGCHPRAGAGAAGAQVRCFGLRLVPCRRKNAGSHDRSNATLLPRLAIAFQQVTWRMALVWRVFFSSSSRASAVGRMSSSILRRSASSFTSGITGRLP